MFLPRGKVFVVVGAVTFNSQMTTSFGAKTRTKRAGTLVPAHLIRGDSAGDDACHPASLVEMIVLLCSRSLTVIPRFGRCQLGFRGAGDRLGREAEAVCSVRGELPARGTHPFPVATAWRTPKRRAGLDALVVLASVQQAKHSRGTHVQGQEAMLNDAAGTCGHRSEMARCDSDRASSAAFCHFVALYPSTPWRLGRYKYL